ncbi:MAG: flippase [bacterium]|nr:flippase [bacterium]
MEPDIHANPNKIASNTLFQIISKFAILLLSLIAIKIITNTLGVSGTGYFNTITTYFGFIIIAADLGLFSVAVREISKQPEKQRKILYNVFTIRLIFSTIFTIIGISLAFLTHYPSQIKYGLLIASLYPIINLVSSVYDIFFQYKLEMKKVAISELFSKIITTVILLIFTYYKVNFYIFMTTIPIAALLIFICKIYLSRNELKLKFEYDKPVYNNLLKMSLPLGIVFIVNNFYFKVDTLILFFFKGATAVGIYSVTYRILETTLFTGSFLSSSLKPLLSTSVHNDPAKTEKALQRGSAFLVFMALFLTISCVTFPREIITLLSNNSFISGQYALVILGFVSIFIYTGGLLGEIMIALDLRRILIRNSIFILLFNVILNVLVIPRYSFTGAAVTTLISEIVLFTITATIVKKYFKLAFDWPRIAKLLGIAFLSILLGYTFKSYTPFLLNLPLVLLFYAVIAYFADAIPREITDNYLKTIKSRFSR